MSPVTRSACTETETETEAECFGDHYVAYIDCSNAANEIEMETNTKTITKTKMNKKN